MQAPQWRKHGRGAAEGLRAGQEQKRTCYKQRLCHPQLQYVRHSEHPCPSASPSIPARLLMRRITVLICASGMYQVWLTSASPSPGRGSHPQPHRMDFQKLRLPQHPHFSLSRDSKEGTAPGDIAAHQGLAVAAPGVSQRGILQRKAVREAPQTARSKGLSSNQAHLPRTTACSPQE